MRVEFAWELQRSRWIKRIIRELGMTNMTPENEQEKLIRVYDEMSTMYYSSDRKLITTP